MSSKDQDDKDAAVYMEVLEDLKVKPKPKPKIKAKTTTEAAAELSIGQKKILINYFVAGEPKAIFEDVPEFFDGMEVKDHSPYAIAIYNFLDEAKEKLLKEIT